MPFGRGFYILDVLRFAAAETGHTLLGSNEIVWYERCAIPSTD